MTLSALAWAMISAERVGPSVERRSAPSPARRMSPSWMVSPASPASFSTTILSPAATRYCLPPVRTTANMAFSKSSNAVRANRRPRPNPRAGTGLLPKAARSVNVISLVAVLALQTVTAFRDRIEQARNGGMVDRLVALVGEQVLLADISGVGGFPVLGEEVVERLVLGGTDLLRDRLIPFVGIGEDRVDVEDDSAKVEQPVPDHLADGEAGMGDRRRQRRARARAGEESVNPVHEPNVGLAGRQASAARETDTLASRNAWAKRPACRPALASRWGQIPHAERCRSGRS